MVHTYASADAAWTEHVASTIKILEHQRDRLIGLVVEGPIPLRSLRLRQLSSIEHRLVAARAEEEGAGICRRQGRDIVSGLAYDFACRPTTGVETMLGWTVVYRNPVPGGPAKIGPEAETKEAALRHARAYEHAGHEVHRIEGPQGQVIGKEEIECWMAANPD